MPRTRPLVLLTLLFASLAQARPAQTPVVICAVADFAVTGLQPRYWLGYTYAELLTRRLRLADNLVVLEPLKSRLVPQLESIGSLEALRDRLVRLLDQLSVPYVISGLLEDRGESVKVSAMVVTSLPNAKENAWVLEQEVPFDDLLQPQTDLVVRRFLPNMGLRLKPEVVNALARWAPEEGPELLELVGQGWRVYAPDQPEDAFRLWRQALTLDPRCDLAGEALATTGYLYRRHLLDNALTYYQQRLAEKPNDPMTNYHLGEIYADNAEWVNAERHFTIAMAGDHAFLDAYLGRITALLGQHRYEDAMVAAQGALQLFPNHPKVMHNLAVAYYRSGNITEARNTWQKILAANPDDALARDRLTTYGGGTAAPEPPLG